MKKTIKTLLIILILITLFACTESYDEQAFDLGNVDVDIIYNSFAKSFSYVHENYYFSTPHWDLDPDYDCCDENHACRARKYLSLEDFKKHMMSDYNLTESFSNELISLYLDTMLYEKEDGLYVVDADRGSNISVGERISQELIMESDDKIIVRSTYESIDINTGKIAGSFDVDSILILFDDKWLWDDIPKVY